jgi:hypothetical protein
MPVMDNHKHFYKGPTTDIFWQNKAHISVGKFIIYTTRGSLSATKIHLKTNTTLSAVLCAVAFLAYKKTTVAKK